MLENKKYRPDIDALRALAILAVMFFHFEFNIASGGFIGVDIFFVISGYLITNIIKNNLECNIFSFAKFYANRLRRILPVLIFISLCVMLAFAIVYSGEAEMESLQRSIKRLMFAIPNIYFYLNTGYFDLNASTMPMLHTWSLGIEEQFYFLFPFFMWYCYKYTLKNILFYTVILALISFILSCILVFYFQKFTFFMLPTRAWELLLGAILALTMYTPNSQKNKRNFIYIGLFLMISPIFTYNTLFFYPFPGLMALPPCLGAVLYISGGTELSEDSPITKIFKCKFLIFIGLISYSLYLWHWPLIVLYKNFYLIRKISTFEAIGGIIICILLSYFSWKFIEMPFRNKIIFRKGKIIYPLALCSIALCLTLSDTMREPFPNGTFYLELDTPMAPTSSLEEMWARQKNDFAFIGDSHRQMWMSTIDKLASQYNLTYLESSTVPQNSTMKTMGKFDKGDMSTWENFTQLVEKQSIHTVFWNYRWPFRVKGYQEDEKYKNKELIYENGNIKLAFVPALLAGLRDSIKTLQKIGVKDIYIINPLPEPYLSVPPAASKLKHRGFQLNDINKHIGESTADYQARTGTIQKVFQQLAAEFSSVHIINISPLLFDEKINHYRAVTEKISYYSDDDHLSIAGTEALKEVFFPAFEKMRQHTTTP